MSDFFENGVWVSGYAGLAYIATLGSATYIILEINKIHDRHRILRDLPKENIPDALGKIFDPVPAKISAKIWLLDRKYRMILIGFISTIAALAPMLYFSSIGEEMAANKLLKFFNLASNDPGYAQTVKKSESEKGNVPSKEENDTSTGQKSRAKSGQPPEEPTREKGGDNTDLDHSSPTPEVPSGPLVNEPSPTKSIKMSAVWDLRSSIEGTVKEVRASVGSDLKKDDPILLLRNVEISDQIDVAEAALNRALEDQRNFLASRADQEKLFELEVATKKKAMEFAKNRLDRLSILKGTVALRAIEEARIAFELAESEVALEEAKKSVGLSKIAEVNLKLDSSVKSARAGKAKAAELLDSLTIRSPADGKLIYVMSPGDATGVNKGRPVARMEIKIEGED